MSIDSAGAQANGDSRSLALFGTMGVWAILEIVFINRRDGARSELPALSLRHDAIAVVMGAAAYGLIGYLHGWLFGVAVLG